MTRASLGRKVKSIFVPIAPHRRYQAATSLASVTAAPIRRDWYCRKITDSSSSTMFSKQACSSVVELQAMGQTPGLIRR